jgi:membrane-bound lytic murein transglycosylase D
LAADESCILLAAAPSPPPVKEFIPAQAPVLLASAAKQDSLEQKLYTVQRGDNLLKIANQHNVTVEQLKEWNELRGTTIMAQQKLRVWQPVAERTSTLLASAEPASGKATSAAVKTVANKTSAKSKPQPEKFIYHVQPGDTLWTISQRHDGITVEQIKKLNKLKNSAIKPGQQLILG